MSSPILRVLPHDPIQCPGVGNASSCEYFSARVTTLRRSTAGWKRLMDAAPTVPHVSEEEAKAARLSPRLVQSLRRRLGLSQMTLARLMGVSAPAVAHWEAGNSTPTGRNRVTLVALRKVKKREVKEVLARRVKETASRASHSRKRRTKRPGRGAAHRRRGVSRE
jgi:DNA-binding transcriptional regulator YiaG